MKQNTLTSNPVLIAAIVGLIAASGGFIGGIKYQQNKRVNQMPTFMTNTQGRMGGSANTMTGTNRNGFRPVSGEVIKIDDNSMTVKLKDGSSKIVLLTTTSLINKAELGTKEDIKNGTQVAVFGSQNADGSVIAQNIQINPQEIMAITPTPSK